MPPMMLRRILRQVDLADFLELRADFQSTFVETLIANFMAFNLIHLAFGAAAKPFPGGSLAKARNAHTAVLLARSTIH